MWQRPVRKTSDSGRCHAFAETAWGLLLPCPLGGPLRRRASHLDEAIKPHVETQETVDLPALDALPGAARHHLAGHQQGTNRGAGLSISDRTLHRSGPCDQSSRTRLGEHANWNSQDSIPALARPPPSPRGYKIRYQVIDFPGGMPGDIGVILSWQRAAPFRACEPAPLTYP